LTRVIARPGRPAAARRPVAALRACARRAAFPARRGAPCVPGKAL